MSRMIIEVLCAFPYSLKFQYDCAIMFHLSYLKTYNIPLSVNLRKAVNFRRMWLCDSTTRTDLDYNITVDKNLNVAHKTLI